MNRVRYITSCLRYGVNRSIFFENGGASKVGPLTVVRDGPDTNGPETAVAWDEPIDDQA